MRTIHIYAIYDVKAGVYMKPWYQHTDAEAKRAFTDIAIDPQHPIGKHPADYTLFFIGFYDDSTGKIEPCDPMSLCTALECVAAHAAADPAQQDLLQQALNQTGIHIPESPGGTT